MIFHAKKPVFAVSAQTATPIPLKNRAENTRTAIDDICVAYNVSRIGLRATQFVL